MVQFEDHRITLATIQATLTKEEVPKPQAILGRGAFA